MAGISGSQYSLIIAIAHLGAAEAGITVTQLAAGLHVSGTYVTAETNKLEQAGYVRRSPNPRDRRSVLLTLTDPGLKLLDRLLPTIQRVNDQIFQGLSRMEFEILQRVMSRLAHS
ncbi:MAG: MarR family winged helix-turn-helix transcriptional regulator, partial [Steroidobacteraceae bacterium]